MKKKLLLFAVLSLIVMSAQAQLKRSAMVHAPTYPQAQLVKPEAKMERAVMRQPGTPVVKPPKKAGSVDVWYRRPAGAFSGILAADGEGVYIGHYIQPYIHVKPYSEYTFNGFATGVSNAATYDWDVMYYDSNNGEQQYEIIPGKDATWKWGWESPEVPIFYVQDGNLEYNWCIKSTTDNQENAGYIMSVADEYLALGYDLLVSSKTFCYGGRYGDQSYMYTYDYGLTPYGNNQYGWWYGKNSNHIDGIAQAFEKPQHPYEIKQVAVYCNVLDVAAPVEMTCKIYKLNEIPAYDDDNVVALPEVPGELICEGSAIVTPETYNNTGGLVTFTLYREEDEIKFECAPTIEDAILVVIDGYNDPAMANLTDFSALISTDIHADEGFGELAYVKYGYTDNDGNIEYYWVGLNNLLETGEMKTGLSIFLNIEQPFVVFNYIDEDGEYTFPNEGGSMQQEVEGEGYLREGIPFWSWVSSEDWYIESYYNNVHYEGFTPEWLDIELIDNEIEDAGYEVQANVVADPLPAGVDYRETIVTFHVPGADPISYTFKQGAGSNPSETSYYIVGSNPFGNWSTNAGAKMTQNSDGTYSYTATIDGTVWFVFADGLTEVAGDWDTFNSQYRYGPSVGYDETVEAGTWHTTQKQGNGNGAYQFTGNGSEYVFTFNPYIHKFKIEGDVTPLPQTYTVAGSPSRVFSTEWDPSNTDNDMTLQDDATYMLQKYDCLLYANEKLQFKVVSNHSWEYAWPSDNYVVDVWATGIYDIIIWFNAETKEVWCDLLPNDAEITPTPVIDYEVTDDAVIITATGNGHVCLYIEDILCAQGEDFAQYVISRTEYDQEYNVSATAQADGMEVSEYALATVYVPAIQIAEKLDVPAPVIETGMDDDNVYVTIIWPETDGDQVYTGEYTYSRPEVGNPDESYVVEAYTTETETYKESEHATATILVPAKEGQEDKATGEYATKTDGSPATSGQCVTDHLFARNEYIDANGQHFVVDNAVSFKDNETQLVWLWLDDDQIYLNEAVQALTPIAYNSAGDLYNEITYYAVQFDIYLPSSVSLTKTETNKMAIWGDRLPSTSSVSWGKKNDIKTIDGITYSRYTVVVNRDFTKSYGHHFSGKDAAMYEERGALKKDDAPLFGLYLEYDNSSSSEIPDMIIANQLFIARETEIAQWDANSSNFYYGTGGNNVEQRFQLYNRVKLTEGDLEPVSHITPMPEITTSMTDNSVVVTATGEGEVKLYIDGVEVSNPYTINRGTEDKTYTATATAQADGMAISETATTTIEVPKMDGDGSYLYINDYQIPASKLGDEIVLPLRAHFDARVSGWLVEMTFPEGITPVYCESGGATTITYLDARGTQQTVKASFTPGPTNTNILSYLGTAGFWLPEGATEYESYGVVKWEAGDYGEMALIYCQVDPNFAGGQLSVYSELSSGNDARGGTIPNQNHTYTTNITIGGQELQGEVLIGDCDANGKVPVSYDGSENVTLDVMIDGQSVPVIDGMVQLKHYGRSIVSAEVTAIGYAPLHVNAEVNWVAINNGDWEILKAFYNQYQNDVLVWDMSDRNKPGSCPGVSSENGRVTAIVLPNHELEGGFPTMLLALNKLTVLDLSYNNLNGDAAADMTQYAAASGIKANGLLELYIHHNDFTGNVGALAALFSDLETLNVSNNHFGQVDPMVNPTVNLSLNNQLLEMNGDITNGLGVLATSLPTICLYDHAGQTFSWDAEITLNDKSQSPEWNMELWLEDNEVYYSNVSGPYRGTNGQSLSGNSRSWGDDGSCNEQLLQVLFSFNLGDANFNGPVDITDLQAMVNYIFGDYYRLFNFTAANLNNDAIVNVQDVVGEANLLLSMELTMPTLRRAPSTDVDLADASLYWENGTLYLNTTVPVTALDIVNDAEGDITWNVDNLGFVVKHATGPQGAHSVIYSLGDAVIEPGVTAIATTTGRTPNVVAAKLSNADAELVDVRLNDRMTGLKSLTEDGKPQCHINGTNLVITNGTDLNDVDIDIYTVDGKLVWGKHVNRLESGSMSFDLSDIGNDHRYYIIVVRNGRQIIATKKLTQIR